MKQRYLEMMRSFVGTEHRPRAIYAPVEGAAAKMRGHGRSKMEGEMYQQDPAEMSQMKTLRSIPKDVQSEALGLLSSE